MLFSVLNQSESYLPLLTRNSVSFIVVAVSFLKFDPKLKIFSTSQIHSFNGVSKAFVKSRAISALGLF